METLNYRCCIIRLSKSHSRTKIRVWLHHYWMATSVLHYGYLKQHKLKLLMRVKQHCGNVIQVDIILIN